jgi:uncharacterized protein with von Willebrand factor type A (vWA) domain
MTEIIKEMEHYPLLELFTELQRYDKESLRRKGFTIEEYLLGLKAFSQGIGLTSEEDLRDTCKLLWLKPYHSEIVFDEIFSRYFFRMKSFIQDKKKSQDVQPDQSQESGKRDSKDSEESLLPEVPSEKPLENQKEEKEQKSDGKRHQAEENLREPELFRTLFTAFSEEETDQAVELKSEDKIAEEVYEKKYVLQGNYFSLKGRKLEQHYQMVRTEIREGRKDTILWKETIQKIAEEGFFNEPVMAASSKRKSVLNLLIDYSGSMIAFHELCDHMAETLKIYAPKKNHVYYFFNYVHNNSSNLQDREILFENPGRTKAIKFDSFATSEPKAILIISDAGAARGKLYQERIERTALLLRKLRQHKVVWVNPIPRERWRGSSAEYISSMTDMYELNEQEFPLAMKKLKLNYRPPSIF